MTWLNYHHLLYFWTVARHGSIARAAEELRLAHPTVSGQVHRLEEVLGEKLLERSGRALVLTEAGRLAFRYAEDIFSLGREFQDTLSGKSPGKPQRLVVGVADALPTSLVRRFLAPVFSLGSPVRLICRADRSLEDFMADLVLHRVDVVLAGGPAGPGPGVRVFSHLLGACGTTFLGPPRLLRALKGRFPRSLDGAPFLLPGARSSVRRGLEQWFSEQGIQPRVVAELDDAALSKELARDGLGVFAVPSVIEKEVRDLYGARVLGRSRKLRQEFYALSVERKIRHPAVAAICAAARGEPSP